MHASFVKGGSLLHAWLKGPCAKLARDQIVCVCVCVSNPVPKGMFIQVVMHAELKNRGQQGVHSSAANEDSCEYSVKQIETSICVPVSLTSFHRSSKRLSSEPHKDQVCSEFFFGVIFHRAS